MKTFYDRLEELKAECQKDLQSRMVFLMNPKDTKILEAIVAWTAMPKRDFSMIHVQDDAPMTDLWKMAEPDIFTFATALGCTVIQATPRLDQLKALGIIYPDGTVADLATSITNIYIKGRVKELQDKARDDE